MNEELREGDSRDGLVTVARLFWRIADRKARRAAGRLVLLAAAAAALELLSLGCIFIFFRGLLSPDKPLPILHAALPSAGLLGLALGLLALTLCRGALGYRLLALRSRVMAGWARNMIRTLFARHLDLSLADAGKAHFSAASTMMTEDLRATFRQVLTPMLVLATEGASGAMIVLSLVVSDPAMACCIGATFWLSLRSAAKIERRLLQRDGRTYAARDITPGILAIIAHATYARKELVIMGRKAGFRARMRGIATRYGVALQREGTRDQLLRWGNEAALFAALAAVMIIALVAGRPLASLLPSLALFGAAGWRLAPLVTRLAGNYAEFRKYEAGAIAILRQLTAAAPDPAPPRPARPQFLDRIIVRDLACGYDRDHPILRDIGCVIEPGTALAVTGRSGIGKTTFVDTLLGLVPPLAGVIEVDGIRMADAAGQVPRWGRLAGYVPQDPALAAGSIAENVRFGAYGLTDDRLWHWLAVVDLAPVVRALPGGLDTMLGERGLRLSGGQRQRLCIARALVNRPALLVLDEGTAQLDIASERRLFAAIKAALPTLALIVVTHRPETAAACDRILDLERMAV